MASIVEYDVVLARMHEQRLRCQYYNSGAFGLEPGVAMHFAGWIGPDDPTIRPASLAHAQKIAPPFESTLAKMATRLWLADLVGPVWVMPKANWAYELDFGSKVWMPAALKSAGVDARALEGRTDSPAIEFAPDEADRFTPLLQTLLENLLGSDFALGFPGHPIACTVHHHKQLWWVSSDERFIERVAEEGRSSIL